MLQLAGSMEQPFFLRARKRSRVVLALFGALWLSIGVASALYVAHSQTVADIAD
jgi:hypothetical protein